MDLIGQEKVLSKEASLQIQEVANCTAVRPHSQVDSLASANGGPTLTDTACCWDPAAIWRLRRVLLQCRAYWLWLAAMESGTWLRRTTDLAGKLVA
eukprot:scaffold3597_cov395-Prasinococcus_capsulatus_cf.AAC.5